MSRTFTDSSLMTWEAYASGGKWGFPDDPKVIFQCLSAPESRARFVVYEDGDSAAAEGAVRDASDDRLRELLVGAEELD